MISFDPLFKKWEPSLLETEKFLTPLEIFAIKENSPLDSMANSKTHQLDIQIVKNNKEALNPVSVSKSEEIQDAPKLLKFEKPSIAQSSKQDAEQALETYLTPERKVPGLELGTKVAEIEIPPKKEEEALIISPQPEVKHETYSFIPYPKKVSIAHTEGVGGHQKAYRTNYSSAEILFAPDTRPGKVLPMIDFRGYRFDNTKYAISTGFALRYVPGKEDDFCNLLGANIYYDYAPNTPGFHSQVGAGVEILGERLDFRANLFAPFGKNRSCGICCDRDCVNGWLSSGFNAEIGYLLFQVKSFSFYSAIGPYYITACKCQERQRGILFRVFPQYKEIVGLNLKYSYDPLFKSIFQAELVISVPFYQVAGTKKTSCGISNRQIFQRVERR